MQGGCFLSRLLNVERKLNDCLRISSYITNIMVNRDWVYKRRSLQSKYSCDRTDSNATRVLDNVWNSVQDNEIVLQAKTMTVYLNAGVAHTLKKSAKNFGLAIIKNVLDIFAQNVYPHGRSKINYSK